MNIEVYDMLVFRGKGTSGDVYQDCVCYIHNEKNKFSNVSYVHCNNITFKMEKCIDEWVISDLAYKHEDFYGDMGKEIQVDYDCFELVEIWTRTSHDTYTKVWSK